MYDTTAVFIVHTPLLRGSKHSPPHTLDTTQALVLVRKCCRTCTSTIVTLACLTTAHHTFRVGNPAAKPSRSSFDRSMLLYFVFFSSHPRAGLLRQTQPPSPFLKSYTYRRETGNARARESESFARVGLGTEVPARGAGRFGRFEFRVSSLPLFAIPSTAHQSSPRAKQRVCARPGQTWPEKSWSYATKLRSGRVSREGSSPLERRSCALPVRGRAEEPYVRGRPLFCTGSEAVGCCTTILLQ